MKTASAPLDPDQQPSATADTRLRAVPVRQGGTRPQSAAGALRTGRVLATLCEETGALWRVALDNGTELETRRASGCLLLPRPGDLVLVFRNPEGADYLLQILEQEAGRGTVQVPGDLALEAPHGSCTITAQEIGLSAAVGRFSFGHLGLLARSLQARVVRVASVTRSLSLAAGHCMARIGRALRLTGFELHRVRGQRTEVEERYSVQAGQVDILAKGAVTVDGEKVNLG